MKPYTELWEYIENNGIQAICSGPASSFIGKQVAICFLGEQYSRGTVLYYNINNDGSEEFVCAE